MSSKPPAGSRIVVGLGGSIAAWKACDLVSKLVQAGAHVEVVMSQAAERFVTPLCFAALTHRPVFTQADWFDGAGAGGRGPAAHLQATADADLLVVAPCTANMLGKFAHGIADEIVSTTFLGTTCPKILAPAMHARMWGQPRVQANVEALRVDPGIHLVGPGTGYLAEAEEGPGRMAEPAEILETIRQQLDAAVSE